MKIYFTTEKTSLYCYRRLDKKELDTINEYFKTNDNAIEELKRYTNKCFDIYSQLIKNGFIVTAPLLRDAYLGRVEKLSDKTLLEIMSMHNDEQEKMVGINVSKATFWISVYTLRLLKDFIMKK